MVVHSGPPAHHADSLGSVSITFYFSDGPKSRSQPISPSHELRCRYCRVYQPPSGFCPEPHPYDVARCFREALPEPPAGGRVGPVPLFVNVCQVPPCRLLPYVYQIFGFYRSVFFLVTHYSSV